ncbi:hypothetical protein HRG_008227 [Hirsutella rhossiliensis]|uniref:2EXR domain-containing protein n=1 Tax=Hirsutella rhossiliensis TaxID=111463 RepID=A0A9P8MTW0_9HYPO|nr:uncharacterized protein HRG_08227 [Hirsutella rhossiliensis]KAH0961074.1 hypothetical protein HRG_08227 [Hirsutella rhossiliensis]
MAAFDLFPNLPCELRLEIWKFAIRPAGRGVHRFSIFNHHTDKTDVSRRLAITNTNQKQAVRHAAAAPRVPGAGDDHGYSWTEGNDSAYLWDAGLWTACREAREVMMWHFRVQYWDDARRTLVRSPGHWTPAAVAEEFEDITAMATARHGGREWHLMMQPHKDLFWLEPRDWKATVEWQTLFLDLPFASFRRGYGHLSHIAVEHDPSWNVDLPKDLGALLQESTPRGFIARAMAECATNKLYCFIWLVDRALVRADPADAVSEDMEHGSHAEEQEEEEAAEEESGNEGEEDAEEADQEPSSDLMTFYDCNRVYMDTDRSDLVPDKYDSDAEYEKTALHFVQLLGTIGNADYSLMGDEDGTAEDFDFRVDEYLGVLACM